MDERSQTDRLPPMEWLRAFDAAARFNSFSDAGRDLNVTQAAISQRIRNLEAHLGARLFERLARGVRLTVEGEAYAPQVRMAMDSLERATADLFSPSRRSVTISASASVIDLWLLPRLAALQAACPDAALSFPTYRRQRDADSEDADLFIRFGNGDWPGSQTRKLYDEVLVPVARHRRSDWLDAPLIALSGPRDGWREWGAGAGIMPPPPTLRFDTFAQARACALASDAVLLGSQALVRDDLKSGRLNALSAHRHKMSSGYWLVWPAGPGGFRQRPALVDAICGETSAAPR